MARVVGFVLNAACGDCGRRHTEQKSGSELMIILAIDTGSDCGSIALARDSLIIDEEQLGGTMQHSRELFPSIGILLAKHRMAVNDVDVFVASRGPGSFTGLRVGMAAVEALAFPTGKRTVAVSSLAALAWAAGPNAPLVAPVLDARRGQVYGSLYRRTGRTLERLRVPKAEPPEEFLASLPRDAIWFCGSGVDLLTRGFGPDDEWSVHASDACIARGLAELAAVGYEEPFDPLYLRAPAALPAGSNSLKRSR